MYAKCVTLISRFFMGVAGLFLVLMMGHVTLDVALKYLFNSPITGTVETVTYIYMVSIVFLPLALVELRSEHIYVDLFVRRFSPRFQMWIYVFACLCGMVYFSGMAYQTFLDAVRSTAQKETVMSNYLFYVWPARWALPVGMGGIVLALAVNIGRAFKAGKPIEAGKEEDPAQ